MIVVMSNTAKKIPALKKNFFTGLTGSSPNIVPVCPFTANS